jgi:hypothetical protein
MKPTRLRESNLQIQWQLTRDLRRLRLAFMLGGPVFFAALFALLKCRQSIENLDFYLFNGVIFGLIAGYACERLASVVIQGQVQILRLQEESATNSLSVQPHPQRT